MGRIFKLKPTRMLAKRPKIVVGEPKRKATTIKRKWRRGERPRVVAGSAVARALGIG